jgi:hypothetical protein
VQDRFRGGGRQGGGRYGGRRRRGRGGRPQEIYPDVALEPEEHVPWGDDFDREPNPDADPLHLAYDSVYTHEGDIREELLESWVEASANGKRWRCWNCGRDTQRFTQLRLPTLRTVISICDNCGTWTVWDAWRDLANPRIFSFRRTMEETEPTPPREPGAEAPIGSAMGSNGSGAQPEAVSSAESPPVSPAAETSPVASEPRGGSVAEAAAPATPEASLQPPISADASPTEAEAAAAAKPSRRTRGAKSEGADETGAPKRPTRPRAKKAEAPAAE